MHFWRGQNPQGEPYVSEGELVAFDGVSLRVAILMNSRAAWMRFRPTREGAGSLESGSRAGKYICRETNTPEEEEEEEILSTRT